MANSEGKWREDLKVFFTDYMMPILIAFVLMFFGIGLTIVSSLLVLIGVVIGLALCVLVGVIGGIAISLATASVRMAFSNLLFGLITLAFAAYCLLSGDVFSAILGLAIGLMIGWVARPWREIPERANVASSHATELKLGDGRTYRAVFLRPDMTLGFELPVWQSSMLWCIVVLSVMVGGFVLKWWGFVWGLLSASSIWSGIWWLFVEAEANAMLFGQLLQREQINKNRFGQALLGIAKRVKEFLYVHFLRWA